MTADALLREHAAAILDGLAMLLDQAPPSWEGRIARATAAREAIKRYLGCVDATTSGELVYGASAPPNDVEWHEGKLISERATEIARERRARTGVYGGWSQEIGDVVRALDERLGRG